jgi:hypothetical protein
LSQQNLESQSKKWPKQMKARAKNGQNKMAKK